MVEQGHWESRRRPSRPPGKETIRNVQVVKVLESETAVDGSSMGDGYSGPGVSSRDVLAKHTYFEYEELTWRKYRSFRVNGDTSDDVRWPEPDLAPGQRVSERREAYRAKFAVGAEEYRAELDEATWRKLRVGQRCRLELSALTDEVKKVDTRRNDGRASRG